MEDNGKGTLKENIQQVKSGLLKARSSTTTLTGEYFLIDNPDPAHLIQRVEILGDTIKIIDNLPIEEAKRISEEELRKTEVPVMKELKQKAADDNYQPSEEEIEKFIDWLAKPNIFLDEGHLQKMYNYKEGSAWDFLLHALGKKKIPTPKERIEKSYISYIHTYNFTDEQIIVLKKIKDVFTSNVASQKNIDEKEIFGNPIYERLIGSYVSVNKLFEGKFNEVINDLKIAFGSKASA